MLNRQILLRQRPSGQPAAADFQMIETEVPVVADGEVLRRTIYLSLDPYMRGRMSAAKSYSKPVEVGDVMVGGTVSEVIESRNPRFSAGDFVVGLDGWQEYAVSDGRSLRRLDPDAAPISTAVGVLGMPGMTAYVGLLDIGQPKPGETVVVSAASGAVGSVVGQIAKIKECRAVGIAGSAEKCDSVVNELGFDACVSHRSPTFVEDLAAACPSGVDVYFENVGGAVLRAALTLLNVGARIPLCGQIADYNAVEQITGPNWRVLLVKRAMVKGFIVFDHVGRMAAFLEDCSRWVQEGRLKYREDIVDGGLDVAPEAFLRLFEGRNFGKLLVQVSPDPTRNPAFVGLIP